jgi:hypothetical protein
MDDMFGNGFQKLHWVVASKETVACVKVDLQHRRWDEFQQF